MARPLSVREGDVVCPVFPVYLVYPVCGSTNEKQNSHAYECAAPESPTPHTPLPHRLRSDKIRRRGQVLQSNILGKQKSRESLLANHFPARADPFFLIRRLPRSHTSLSSHT